MNKIFCRAYQGAAKVALNFLPWRMPEVIQGAGAVTRLPQKIKSLGHKKALVVTGSTIIAMGMLDPFFRAMEEAGVEYEVFSGVPADPTDTVVMEGVKRYHDTGCDCFVPFGGGSPMDCCKAIAAAVARPGKTPLQLRGLLKVRKRVPAVFAVPTTAGTGSETTIAAVITDSKTHRKASISDTALIPDFAVLDPELTVALPPKITSTTGMDALCHAVEAYTNGTYMTALERGLAEEAVRLIYENLEKAYTDGSDITARQNMQLAAFKAGRAFTRGSVGYVHAMGHTLGGIYGTPHGLAMAVILPHVLRLYGQAVHRPLAKLADACGMDFPPSAGDAAKAEGFISWICDLNERMDIPSGFDFIKEEDLPKMMEWAMAEANPLYPVPVIWQKSEFQAAFRALQA